MDQYKFGIEILGEDNKIESYHYVTIEANSRQEADELIKKQFPNNNPELVQIDDDIELLQSNSFPKKGSKKYKSFTRRY